MPIPIPTREYSMNTIRTLAIAAFVLGGVTLARAERCAIAVSDPKVDFGRVFGDRIGAPRGADRRPVASANRALAVQCRQESVAAIRFDGVPSADGSIRFGDVARHGHRDARRARRARRDGGRCARRRCGGSHAGPADPDAGRHARAVRRQSSGSGPTSRRLYPDRRISSGRDDAERRGDGHVRAALQRRFHAVSTFRSTSLFSNHMED